MSLLNYAITDKQKALHQQYASIAKDGYRVKDEAGVFFFDNSEVSLFKKPIKKFFEEEQIKSCLDYGSGMMDYNKPFKGETIPAQEYLGLETVRYYEPGRGIDERVKSDAVICTDVLEHVFLYDLPNTVRELFELSNKVIFVNVACYEAGALLPNGENVHTIVRPPDWWRGVFDSIAPEHPDIKVALYCSTSHDKGGVFEPFRAKDWLESSTFVN